MEHNILTEECRFTLIRIGRGYKNSDGDFIDNIIPELYLAVLDFVSKEKIAIHGPSIKFNYLDHAWTIPVEDIVKQLDSNIKPNILAGIYRSTYEKNDAGLVIHDALNSKFNNYFEAVDQDPVKQYGDSIFGIGSITNDLDIQLNKVTGEVFYNGASFKNISDLYGNFDEDDWWVIGITL